MNERQLLGQSGEAIAADFLRSKGYAILASNWRFSRYELDLVARKGDTLIIVEVKTRATENGERPELAVSKSKQRKLIRAANAFLANFSIRRDKPGTILEMQFDIIAVRRKPSRWLIYHVEDAFFPGL